MPDYKETDVEGIAWQRCKSVRIDNPRSGAKTAYFDEERVVAFDDESVARDVSVVSREFDPEATIPLLNPDTLVATGETVTHLELYVILFSLYIQVATDRDNEA